MSATPIEFGNLNPTDPGCFAPFSTQRLITALGSNVVDVTFFVPGSTQAALTRGFGAVFSDVDLASTTSIGFFDASNALLNTFFAPSQNGNETFSFLGVDYGSAVVSRVRIVNGDQALGPSRTGDASAAERAPRPLRARAPPQTPSSGGCERCSPPAAVLRTRSV